MWIQLLLAPGSWLETSSTCHGKFTNSSLKFNYSNEPTTSRKSQLAHPRNGIELIKLEFLVLGHLMQCNVPIEGPCSGFWTQVQALNRWASEWCRGESTSIRPTHSLIWPDRMSAVTHSLNSEPTLEPEPWRTEAFEASPKPSFRFILPGYDLVSVSDESLSI